MNWSTSVLSTLSSDTEPTILITFDSAKYLFNVGENTGRSFLQSKQNWKKTRGVFLTSVGTQRGGGLAGTLMTFADATISRLNILGPPGLLHFVASMRSYTYRDSMPVSIIEANLESSPSFPPEPFYKDENITVYSVPVFYANTVSSPPVTELDVASLKRKREASPDLPSKRVASVSGEPSSLEDVMADRAFNPESLKGELAQEWRRLMIQYMLPGTGPNSTATLVTQGQGQGKGKAPKQKKGAPSGVKETKIEIEEEAPAAASSSSKQLGNLVQNYRNRPPGAYHQQLPHFSPSKPDLPPPTLAYIVVGPRIRGKFNVEKADALGVVGRLRSQLTKGIPVTIQVKEGDVMVDRVIQPEECVAPSEVPGVNIILDIPTPGHIDSLLSSFCHSQFFAKFRSKKAEDMEEYAVRTIFHILGNDVLEDPRYIDFMNGFAPDVQHLVASRKHVPDPITFTTAAYNQLRLNQLDPEMFPLQKYRLDAPKDLSTLTALPRNTAVMASNLLINMRPYKPAQVQEASLEADQFHPIVTASTPFILPPLITQKFKEARSNVERALETRRSTPLPGDDVTIVPLGTGSSLPSKHRNVMSNLIQIPGWGNIILDAGEGTWGQLVRMFGLDETLPNNVWTVLRDLKCIFISHIHGDHHMGLATILEKRRLLEPPPTEPLYLVSIRALHLYLREESDIQNLGIDDPSGNGVVTILSEAIHWTKPTQYMTNSMWRIGGDEAWLDIRQSQENTRKLCQALGLQSFSTVDVHHRSRCYGPMIRHKDGWSIVFSGDTLPTENIVRAGRNATLLIHEASMADDEAELAQLKAHSTFGQAIDIGRRMRAKNILLTHFSARYPKMPPGLLANAGRERGPNEPTVALAFDHANLSIGNMWKMNYYMAALDQNLQDTAEAGDDEVTPDIDMPAMIDAS